MTWKLEPPLENICPFWEFLQTCKIHVLFEVAKLRQEALGFFLSYLGIKIYVGKK